MSLDRDTILEFAYDSRVLLRTTNRGDGDLHLRAPRYRRTRLWVEPLTWIRQLEPWQRPEMYCICICRCISVLDVDFRTARGDQIRSKDDNDTPANEMRVMSQPIVPRRSVCGMSLSALAFQISPSSTIGSDTGIEDTSIGEVSAACVRSGAICAAPGPTRPRG